MQSKLILCKKCNKIFYWKDHYELCDQSYFIETNKLFDDIKQACEEGIIIIKLFNSQPNIFIKYKKNIFGKLKKILKQISDQYKKEINNGIKKLLFTQKKIDFNTSKKEIISFLELCLPFGNYFDRNEINNILEKYNFNSPQRNMNYKNNNLGLSPYNDHLLSYSPFCLKNINDYPAKKSSTIMIPGMRKGNQNIVNYRKNTDKKLINNANNKTIKEMHEYFKNQNPTYKNEYTGIYEGKNLVVVMGESLNDIAISEKYTPTLYKLAHEGFEFTNFYTPINMSTIGGEFQMQTGLFANLAMLTTKFRTGSTYFPYGLGKVFNDREYYCFLYES